MQVAQLPLWHVQITHSGQSDRKDFHMQEVLLELHLAVAHSMTPLPCMSMEFEVRMFLIFVVSLGSYKIADGIAPAWGVGPFWELIPLANLTDTSSLFVGGCCCWGLQGIRE